MAFHTFTSVLAYDEASNRGIAGTVGHAFDHFTGGPVDTFDMDERSAPLIANPRGYKGDFKTRSDHEVIDVIFGTIKMTLVAVEVIKMASDSPGKLADMTAQYLRDVSAQNLRLGNVSDRLDSVEVLAGLGPGDTSDATVKSHIVNPSSDTAIALSAAIDVGAGSPGLLDQMAAAGFPSMSSENGVVTSATISGVSFTYGTEKVLRIGCRPVTVSQNGSTYIQSQGVGQSGSGATPWAVEFLTDSASITLEYRAATGSPELWAWIDGRPVSVRPSRMSATGGFKARFTLTLGYKKMRRIRVWMRYADFGGLIIENGATINPPRPREILRCAWIGDSWIAGAAGVGWPNTVPYVAGALLGWESLYAGIGGSGYVQSSTPYGQAERRDAVVAYAPHIVVAFGSINDRSKSYAEIYAAAIALYADYAVRLPNSKIIVFGPQLPLPGTDTVRDALRTAAFDSPNVLGFIDILDLISGAGSIADPTGSGNADMYLAADKAHPTRMGASFVARRLVERIVTIMAQSDLPVDEWTGTDIPDPNQPTFTPDGPLTDILLSDLLVEVDANTLALSNGAPIPSFAPSRGSKADVLTGVGPPAFLTAASHGRKAVKFLDGYSLISGAYAQATPAGVPLTFYSVHRLAMAGSGSQHIYRFGTGSPSPGIAHVSAGGGYAANAAASIQLPNQLLTGAGGWRVDAVVIGGGMVKHWENSSAKTGETALSSSSASAVLTRIGGQGGGTSGYETHISCVLAYEGEHTAEQVSLMMEFLATKWGITLT